MAQDIFDNAAGHGEIARTKLRNMFGREFLNNTDYFDNLDVNNIKFDDIATDLHVMTKTENGDYISEPLNVVLSRIKATGSTAKCTEPDGVGLTQAEYAMKKFWYRTANDAVGLHAYVNTEPDATKPKKLEAKYLNFKYYYSYSTSGMNISSKTNYSKTTLDEENLEDRISSKLKKAKAAGRHCDSKGWLNFKKFFSGKATKEKLQKEYDDYQTLKVTVVQDEAKYKAATQSKCDVYSSTNPERIAAIENETFEASKREVAQYNETEKAANMQLAAKVIAKSADKLPDYEKMRAHYVNALINYEGFNKHTMGQTQSILGNEKEEADLIKYINQPGTDRKPSRIQSIIAVANESYKTNGAIGFDKPEPENGINENALEGDKQVNFSKKALKYIPAIGLTPKTRFLFQKPTNIVEALIKNNEVFKEFFNNEQDDNVDRVLNSDKFKREMYSEKNITILKLASKKSNNWTLDNLDNQAKEALKEATEEFDKTKDMQSANYVADRVMDVLAIKDDDKISPDIKTAMRKAISSNKAVIDFVDRKNLDDIKEIQNDPKKKHEYQAVINSVLKEYNPTLFDNKAARPKPIEKKANAVAHKNQENIIG